MREFVLAALLAVAGCVIAVGVGMVCVAAGVITFGVLVAVWAVATFGDVL